MGRGLLGKAGIAVAMALLFAVFGALPASAAGAPPALDTTEAYLVMDADTGQVLVAKNPHLAEYPASITKILTLAITLEYVNIAEAAGEPITVSQAAVDALIPRASMIALQPGEVTSLRDLLYATMIESANDAANVLAEYLCGNIDGFAQLMNEKVRQLGLEGSHFMNPSGQPDDNHYTTAYDMAAITRYALSVPGFSEIFGTTEYQMAPTNLRPNGTTFRCANLIQVPQSGYYCEGVLGSKTGYTDAARYTLVTAAQRGGTRLICVSLNNQLNADKYSSTNQLLDYCFENFAPSSYPVQQVEEQAVPVFGGGLFSLGDIQVYGQGEASFLLHKDIQLKDIQVEYQIPERYVVGEDFAPMAVLSLPEDCPQQYSGQLATLPLSWRGLEAIMAEHTEATGLVRMAEEEPVLFWVIVAAVALVLGLFIGRIAYVRHRRQKRRQQRLEAARAQLPIRIAPRPEPPARSQARGTAYGRAARPQLQVVGRGQSQKPAEHPRRVGRAR